MGQENQIRENIWKATSYLYLDSELDWRDYREMAFLIIESGYTFKEAKAIDKIEVFPVLFTNLLHPVGGIWGMFEYKWLVDTIDSARKSRNIFKSLLNRFSYWIFKPLMRNIWSKFKVFYESILENPDNFIIECRSIYIQDYQPFDEALESSASFNRIKKLARLQMIYGQGFGNLKEFLQDGFYHINFWSAYFILESCYLEKVAIFEALKKDSELLEQCFSITKKTIDSLKSNESRQTGMAWYKKIKTTYNNT